MESKEIVRDSILDLLDDNNFNIEEDIDSQTLTFEKIPSTIQNNERLEKCKERAEKVMNTMLRLYLSENFITKSEYIKAKSNLDSMTLSKIMNQMEVSERAINILMEEIELGDVSSKLFDSLGNLQRTFIDLTKTLSSFIINAQNEYEKISADKDGVIEVETTQAEEISKGFKSNDQKNLMRMIRNAVNDKK